MHSPAWLEHRLDQFSPVARLGRVTQFIGTTIRARIPDVRIGERCIIRRHVGDLPAEVIGFDEDTGVLLMPLGCPDGISQDDPVHPADSSPTVACGDAVRGRVLDALGEPIDGRGPLSGAQQARLAGVPPPPLSRQRIATPLVTGVRVIDALLTVGVGQRVGIFAPAGGGKSVLLASLARNVQADAVVLALIGERGREVAPFIADNLGPAGLAKSTVVVSTSDQPALLRLKAALTATAVAEALRLQGQRVVLLMDSVTRFARALREVGLAAGELPARRGYPPSVFAALPQLFERTGNDAHGSITAFYTVLVEGDLQEDPIAEETKSLLDGHFVLSDALAQRQHYPAVDVLRSRSRLMNELVAGEQRADAAAVLRALAVYEENRNKIELGLYEAGSNPAIDDAIRRHEAIDAFLRQPATECEAHEDTLAKLHALAAAGPSSAPAGMR